jgi:hypothetical protein
MLRIFISHDDKNPDFSITDFPQLTSHTLVQPYFLLTLLSNYLTTYFTTSTLRTIKMPTIELNISRFSNSPRGTRFMLPSPEPEADGRECWDADLRELYDYYLERSGNRSVLTIDKREAYRRWLRNPSGPLVGATAKARARDANTRTQALRYFELQDNQVYRKSETIKSHRFPARYAVCMWDSFEIIYRIHRALKHFGLSCDLPPLFSGTDFV